jgi:hypothetical protein
MNFRVFKAICFTTLFSVLFLLSSRTTFAASQCGLDKAVVNGTSVNTYCSLSCGNNAAPSGFEGCGFAQICCAETGQKCDTGCKYGRKTYCSISGGGNPSAGGEFQDCGFGRHCWLGSVNDSCPKEMPPAGNLCGINGDPVTGTPTFCASIACGLGSVSSNNNVSSCQASATILNPQCCAVSPDRCGGCQYGRREYCSALNASGDAAVAKSCSDIASKCFLGEFDPTCPAPEGDPVQYCKLSPYVYKGVKHKTYCSLHCGGNVGANLPGCGGLGWQCCVSPETFEEKPPDSFFSGDASANTTSNFCDQIPPDQIERGSGMNARDACKECQSKPGLWTAVGCIPTTYQGITSSIIKIGLSVAGGVALLMILAAAFTLTTSQGEPKAVTEAKDQLTAAVIGLLFIIFSVTILQFIGVKILQLPGFGT